jgi:hypothetical protein
MAAGDLVLHHANGAITLHQAEPPRFTEARDVRGLRSPFGDVVHRLGTGKPSPAVITVKGTLTAESFIEADAALAQLEESLPTVTAIEIGGQRVPVLGAGGVMSSVPLLTGWRVTLQLLSHPSAAWTGDTADSTMWTADTTLLTADAIGL